MEKKQKGKINVKQEQIQRVDHVNKTLKCAFNLIK